MKNIKVDLSIPNDKSQKPVAKANNNLQESINLGQQQAKGKEGERRFKEGLANNSDTMENPLITIPKK